MRSRRPVHRFEAHCEAPPKIPVAETACASPIQCIAWCNVSSTGCPGEGIRMRFPRPPRWLMGPWGAPSKAPALEFAA
eukprot:699225-Pyramimonas_sp.AAC.1